ncbi:MAG: septum formation inhibitor [Bacteroidales bacterium]|jgi:RNase adaptor protein for sRNA GlmZ degradation|nr:septum formation inhibitor [Bacteroidales bacterium]
MIRLKFINKLPAIFRNKYILTILIFLIWLLLLDTNSLISRYREIRNLHQLRKDKEYFLNKIEIEKSKLKELRTDNHNLEKFAREQYRMKKADEDLYIVLTPKEDRKIRRKNK